MHRRLIVRAALVCGLAGAAWCAWSTIDNSAARADGRPAAVAEHPGGLLDTVEDIVDQVVPEPTKPAEPEPTTEPEPEPQQEHSDDPAPEPESGQDTSADEPTPDDTTTPTPPADPVGDVIEDTVDEVEDAVVEVVEVITTPPPPVVVAPPPVTAPIQHPIVVVATDDEQPDTDPTPATEPVAPPVTTPVTVDLPAVIGPTATAQLVDDGIYPPGTLPEPTPAIADCDSGVPVAGGEEQGSDAPVTRQTAKKRTTPTVTDAPRPRQPCPGVPAGPTVDGGNVAALHGGGGYGADRLFGATQSALTWPTLTRLYELRPRSDVPAGRTTHLDPDPA